jgi:hypothetical protein
MFMESTADIEKRLIELDMEIHSSSACFEKKEGRNSKELVESAWGAWGYGVESEEFLTRCRNLHAWTG